MKNVNDKAKKIDADRLISITYIKENEIPVLYYHFSKTKDPEMKEMRIELAPNETVESMIPVYANAELLESEVTEMHGVKFEGNPSSGKRLFLEEKEGK